jgi:hypothetical protein
VSYENEEIGVESGEPVELYEFAFGSVPYLYTSAEDEILLGAGIYEPVAGIKRGKIEDGPERRNADFTVELPTTDPLAQRFLAVLPGVRVSLTVRRYHRGDTGGGGPEAVTIFSGFVLSANFSKKGRLCTLAARNALASLGRIIPSRSYMSSCNHIHYEPNSCRADDTSPLNRVSAAVVTSQAATLLTVPGLSLFPDGSFDGGYVEAIGTDDFRLILSHVGDVVSLLTPFPVQPSTVNVFRGCGHTIEACHDDFDNVLNFGGFAFVPRINPFASSVLALDDE